MLTIIIPARNEEAVIADCLKSLSNQTVQSPIEIVVSANGCTDNTVDICKSFETELTGKGFQFVVLNTTACSKNEALNLADTKARYPARLYLDADVKCGPDLLRQACQLLERPEAVYFSGSLSIPDSDSFFSNSYGRIWMTMPYIRTAVTGIGCYGVNARGRKMWDKFPRLHSDDKFVRMLFTTEQRHKISAYYEWPVPQGLFTLIKVRARWIKGNRELRDRFPLLFFNDGKRLKMDRQSLFTMMCNPLATLVFFFVYGSASLVSLLDNRNGPIQWSRAR
jgi:glycosyltransferase involved in cell wall biosynthesis